MIITKRKIACRH